jgi:hypothetical protein
MIYKDTTLPLLKIMNSYNNDIINEYDKYMEGGNPTTMINPEWVPNIKNAQARGYYCNVKGLIIWVYSDPEDNLFHHFPSVKKLITDIDENPNMQTRFVTVFISPKKNRVPIHVDAEKEFIDVVEKTSKLKGKAVKQIRAHIPLSIPEKCMFYHFSDKIEKVQWEIGNCFAFDQCDKHFTMNDSDTDRAIIVYDLWLAV